MSARRPPADSAWLPPGTQGIAQVLDADATLNSLARRIEASRARLQAIMPLLPPALRSQVQGGPCDDEGWTLLAANNAALAKLRQMVPAFEAQLRSKSLPTPALRLKLLIAR